MFVSKYVPTLNVTREPLKTTIGTSGTALKRSADPAWIRGNVLNDLN